MLLGLGQRCNRIHGSTFHLLIDCGCAHIKRTAEHVGKTQRIVYLVRVVGAACRQYRIRPYRDGLLRQDFRVGVGQRKNQGLRCHLYHHFRFQYATCRQAQEHIGTNNHFRQSACAGGDCITRFILVHLLGAPLIYHALDICNDDVLHAHTQTYQHVQAGKRCRTGTGYNQFYFSYVFIYHLKTIQQCSAYDDGRAVLVVVKDRNTHALTQFALDIKTFGCLDVFQIDASKGGFQRSDNINQLVRIRLINFQIEHVDPGKFLEQNALAFHHRFCCQWTNSAQTQYCCAIGNHRNQITPCGKIKRLGRIGHDSVTGCRHAR